MKFSIVVIVMVIVGGITIGNVMAATFNETVFVNGEFKVTGGSATVQKSGAPSAITVQNSGNSSLIKLFDIDTNQEMHLRMIPSGTRVDFANISLGGVPLSISMATNNVGIGQLNPVEKLDVNGNVKITGDLKLSGSIKSSTGGDICIGKCT